VEFVIVDTLPAYQRLLDAPDAAAREAIFLRELVEPFQGLVNFFGGDGLKVFASWNMSPDQFAGDSRPKMQALINALAAADAPARAVSALEQGRAAFERHVNPIPLERVIFGLCIADMSSTPWNGGYTGFGGIPGWVMTVYGEATDYNLKRVEAVTAHELHHNLSSAIEQARDPSAANWTVKSQTMTVGEYMVNEGLAESFATELYGEEMAGPWVSGLEGETLEKARSLFQEAISLTGFQNIQKYLFGGAEFGLPPTAGYAVGYHVVQAYLKRSGKSVVEASLLPRDQIIVESGFFDNDGRDRTA
jgi:uncharacterized protein YjaZ